MSESGVDADSDGDFDFERLGLMHPIMLLTFAELSNLQTWEIFVIRCEYYAENLGFVQFASISILFKRY